MVIAFRFEGDVAQSCDRFYETMQCEGRGEKVAIGLATVFEQLTGLRPVVELIETTCMSKVRQ